jgi:threonine/homoserine/homoserine lactone efflux protein
MIIKGFRFGMLLQLAVGPICLMVFNTSASEGLLYGLLLVMAITLIDGLYITLSGVGVAAMLNHERIKLVIKLFGCVVLVLFGLSTITGALDKELLPSLTLFHSDGVRNIFLKGLIMTASNPLTIIFWSGVFSSQVIQHGLKKQQLIWFGFGCVLSTLTFLSLVAILGKMVGSFLPPGIITGMNVVVGGLLIVFGIRLLLTKDKN